ncbi:MAG: hypothetical protein ABI889_05050 [Gemmatimonadota bacterium]
MIFGSFCPAMDACDELLVPLVLLTSPADVEVELEVRCVVSLRGGQQPNF